MQERDVPVEPAFDNACTGKGCAGQQICAEWHEWFGEILDGRFIDNVRTADFAFVDGGQCGDRPRLQNAHNAFVDGPFQVLWHTEILLRDKRPMADHSNLFIAE